MSVGRIYHLMTTEAWSATAPGVPLAEDQFLRHGFVHCCFREQITEIATWWFDDADGLIAVELDPGCLDAEVRFERSPSRWFPHVFGPLDAGAVLSSHALVRDARGAAALPASLRHPAPGFQLTGKMRPSAAPTTVRWQPGKLSGDDGWIQAAHVAIDAGRLVPVMGGVLVPVDLNRAYESFAVLAEVADSLDGYDGDGFFHWPGEDQSPETDET